MDRDEEWDYYGRDGGVGGCLDGNPCAKTLWGGYGLPDCESAQTLSKLSWINAWVFMHTGLKSHPCRITQTLTTKCCAILINTVY